MSITRVIYLLRNTDPYRCIVRAICELFFQKYLQQYPAENILKNSKKTIDKHQTQGLVCTCE